MDKDKSLIKKLSQLFVCIAMIWFVAFQVLPFITRHSSAAGQLAEFIDASGIETGQFYYTGVEIVTRAESSARGSVYFAKHHKK